MWTFEQFVAASERADDLEAEGRHEEAIALLEEARREAQAAGDTGMALFFEGEVLGRRRDYARELPLLVAADRAKPNCHLILRKIAVNLGNLGKDEEALSWIDKALAAKPDDYHAMRGRAVALTNLARADEALAWFDKALTVKPDDYPALRGRGVALCRFDRPEEALVWFDKALAVNPEDYRALRGRGIALCILVRTKESLAWFDKALAIKADDYRTMGWRGFALSKLRRKKEALSWFDRALAIKPDDRFVLRRRALTLAILGRQEESQKALTTLDEEDRRKDEERRAAERQAEEQKIKLNAWRALSARSAHRIGNQLFASRGALRTLKESTSAEAREAVQDLEGSLDRIGGIVREFRQFSLNAPPRLGVVNLTEMAEMVARRYGGLSEDVEVSWEVEGGVLETLADPDQIEQALGELVENAVHHTPPGGSIRVSAKSVARPGGKWINISVKDTGPGVPDKNKARIFEAFFTTRPGGSGLGLAIVKQIVENHGGTIRETGQAGSGANFEIELPVRESQEKGT